MNNNDEGCAVCFSLKLTKYVFDIKKKKLSNHKQEQKLHKK